jgi:ribosomal-protein-alanine N-acetyltransferase
LAPWLSQSVTHEVEGRRTYLRAPQLDDYESWRDLRLASREFLEPWEPTWDDSEYVRAAFRLRVRRYETLAHDDMAHAYFIFSKADDSLLGALTLSNLRRGVAHSGTLGYWIGEPYAGRGLMTDALISFAPYAFSELSLHRLEAACLPRNTPSACLLTRCGFELEGRARSYLKIRGVWEDHLLFARVAS